MVGSLELMRGGDVKGPAGLADLRLVERIAGKEIINRPRYHSPASYEAALAEYLEQVIHYETIKAVYRIGSVGVPGLSDIDLIIVMKDRARDAFWRYSIERLSPEARYLFSHEAMFMSEEEFRSLPLWFPTDRAAHVYGEQVPYGLGDQSTRIIKAIHLCQMLTCYQFHLLAYFAYAQTVFNERVTESIVKGLCNSIGLWQEIDEHPGPDRYSRFAQDYLVFRRCWFELDEKERTERFRHFVAAATVLALELIRDLGKYLSARWFNEVERLDNVEIELGHKTLRFVKDWDIRASLNGISEGGILTLPASLGAFILSYRGDRGLIGPHIGNLFRAVSHVQIRWRDTVAQEALRAHRSAVEAHASFYAEKFHVSPNPFITFWAPHTSNPFIRLYDRVNNWVRKLVLQRCSSTSIVSGLTS